MVNVPSFAVPYIRAAAAGTGLPYAVVACQVNEESGFNASAVSPAGAEGPYQFLPSTFAAYASGSPFSWRDGTIAYVAFMSALLRTFHGNVRDALAAYNAGPGNIGAGFGYADTILSCAGTGNITTTPSGVSFGGPNIPAPTNVSADDWSYYIQRTFEHIEALSSTAEFWALNIGKL